MNRSRYHALSAILGEPVVVRSRQGVFYAFGKLKEVHEAGDADDTIHHEQTDRDSLAIEMLTGQIVRYVATSVVVAKVGEFV